MNNENQNKPLDNLKQSLANLDKKISEMKANVDVNSKAAQDVMGVYDELKSALNSIYASMSYANEYIHQRIDNVNSRMNDHEKNHVPAMMSPTHMKNFIKACGMEDDYQVEPKTIYSYAHVIKASKNGVSVQLNLSKNGKNQN